MQIKLNKPFARNSGVDEYDVKQIKKALNRLGYYQPYKDSGITGIPDAGVFAALKSFQKDAGLRASGAAKPDDETVAALNTAVSKTPPSKYVWRTVGDDRVRAEHAALEGEVREWSDSPEPGEEFNCRCWAEPFSATHNICNEAKKEHTEAQKRVKELSERLNDLLLQLDKLIVDNNKLVENAQKSLGGRIVAFILGLPFDRFGILGELMQRYFEDMISDQLIQSAKNFMHQLWAVKQKIQHTRDQTVLIFSQLEKAAKQLEDKKKKLEECEENEKES